jgi:hypothetical protein
MTTVSYVPYIAWDEMFIQLSLLLLLLNRDRLARAIFQNPS